MDLSVIILNYNTKDLLRKCLSAASAGLSGSGRIEIIVADNGSADGSQDMVRREFPQVRLLENGANLGFAKGNNAAIKQAAGRYVLLLNSDTEVAPDAFALTIEYLDGHPEVGALGGKVVLPDGSLDQACRRRFPNPVNSFLRLFGLRRFSDYNISAPVDQEMEVDAVMGAYMAVRRTAIDQVGLLDEEFFMYGEDLDWCWRIKQAGFKIVYYPKIRVTHFKYGSSQRIPFRTIRLAHQAMRIFYRKHYASRHNPLANALVYSGIWLRQYLVMAANVFRSKKTVH